MISRSKDCNDNFSNNALVIETATFLAAHYLKSLFRLCKDRNYFFYASCMSEIGDWAEEFHKQDGNSVYEDELLIEWGNKKLQDFISKNNNHTEFNKVCPETRMYS